MRLKLDSFFDILCTSEVCKQKRGFVISAIRTNVMEAQRKLKPIPLLGNDGIEIRDEIELEMLI